MLKNYYVNKNAQPTGEHEVHAEDCPYMPHIQNRQYLGCFDNCKEALKKAKDYYNNVDGCYYCASLCHTR